MCCSSHFLKLTPRIKFFFDVPLQENPKAFGLATLWKKSKDQLPRLLKLHSCIVRISGHLLRWAINRAKYLFIKTYFVLKVYFLKYNNNVKWKCKSFQVTNPTFLFLFIMGVCYEYFKIIIMNLYKNYICVMWIYFHQKSHR